MNRCCVRTHILVCQGNEGGIVPASLKSQHHHVLCRGTYPLSVVRWVVVLETCLRPSAVDVRLKIPTIESVTYHVKTRESSAAVVGEFSSMHEVKKRHALLSVAQHPTTK